MLVQQVREAILRNQSGSIFVTIVGAGSRSCTYDSMKTFIEVCNLQALVKTRFAVGVCDIETNMDTGELTPMTNLGWKALEAIHESNPDCPEYPGTKYALKVNGQMAAHSNSRFHGLIDVEHDLAQIRKEQRRTEQERRESGYGSSTMGGWVDL